MDKSFQPGPIESKWYDYWENHGCFKPTGKGDPYCIVLPPPNVTGTLHMGHAFQQTVMDMLIRYQRMSGKSTLWQVGTDHAGIATQKIVENQLAAQDTDKHALGREAFIDRVWQWKGESGSTITTQMRRLGTAADWSRERFTMDEGLSAAVRKVFIEWYRDGLIYRGNRLVNWDPVLGTAVSDLEVDNVESQGSMWYICYPFADGPIDGVRGMTIATTRPETMLADGALAVHPEDERYRHLVGKYVDLPLCNRRIPIIADDYVDREFGSGCVKITGAHDFNDHEVAKRHDIEMITIMTLDAHMNDLAPEAYRGMDRYEARKAVVADLERFDFLLKVEPHTYQLPISQRSEAVIEPMLTDQWFVDLTSDKGREKISGPALDAVRSGKIKFVPENWTNTYTQWLDNIQDWCISRQLWWGHRIPAFYDEAGNIFVGEDEADARAHATTEPVGALRQDDDVLDTWFSSALWPFSTLGWPLDGPVTDADGNVVANWSADKIYLPSAVLVTGFDIIFFWVARMVMATLYFTGEIPFKEVYINAIVRDAEGKKMSKSKGNTLDPLDLIDGIELEPLVVKSTEKLLLPKVRDKVEKRIRKQYPDGIPAIGTDALRFTFAALASYSRTINFDISRAEGYKAFCNKLWNAARFVLMNVGDEPLSPRERGWGEGAPGAHTSENTEPSSVASRHLLPEGEGQNPATAAERWILTRLKSTLAEAEQHFASYRFDHLAQALYEFVWNEYCDWFLELAKPALNGDDEAAAASTRRTLLTALENVLRALHPVIPFITEEIWQEVAPRLDIDADTIMARPYPRAADFTADPDADADIEWLKAVLSGVRRIRAEMNIAPSKSIDLLLADGEASDRQRAREFAPSLAFLGRLQSQDWLAANDAEPPAAASVVGKLRVLIPLAGLIDLDAEKARLEREIKRIGGEIRKCEGKLGNARFVDNAPAEVVAQERDRLGDWSTQRDALAEQLKRLEA
ncbi:MAG TPA: valine--tRNA ligase [Oleiagrimonas sp.]|nr:valine--tRNA ligase [Oleiagrimonas sp.]